MRYKFFCCLLLANFSPGFCIADDTLIAIDIGHSRIKPGAVSARGKTEFEFNLALAKTLQDKLSANGYASIVIGKEGKSINLMERAAVAQRAGAKFLVSIHHDSVQPQFLKSWQWQGKAHFYSDKASGFSVFVSRKNPFLATSLQCAKAIGAELKAKGRNNAVHHAERIPGEGKEWADKNSGIYYYDNLVVLKSAQMPATLLEAGVIVNRDEEQSLQTPAMRETIADAITGGLQHCGILKNSASR